MSDNEDTKGHTRNEIKILKKFYKRINKEKFLNNASSNYYAKLDSRFTIPTLITTGVSSFISLLSTSDMFNKNQKQYCSMTVGLLVGIATVINSISSSYGFNNKKESFNVSADSYDKLLTKIEFEILNPNEKFNEFCDNLETSILEIKSNCKFLPPLFTQKLYNSSTNELSLDEAPSNSPESSVMGDDITSIV
jgi:hypothetical protein